MSIAPQICVLTLEQLDHTQREVQEVGICLGSEDSTVKSYY